MNYFKYAYTNNFLACPESPPLNKYKVDKSTLQNGLVVPVKKSSVTTGSSSFSDEKSSNEMAAMYTLKSLSNKTNYVSSINKNDNSSNSLHHQNIQITNNGSKFSIADILGLSSIEAIASSFASSTSSSSMLSTSAQSLLLHSKSSISSSSDDFEGSNKITENNSLDEKKTSQSNMNISSSLSNINFQQINNLISSNKASNLYTGPSEIQLNRNTKSNFQNSVSYSSNSLNQLIATNQFIKNDKTNEYRQQNLSNSLQIRNSNISLLSQTAKYNRFANLSEEKTEQKDKNKSKPDLYQEYDSEDNDDDDNG